jgi:hypothetical protein
MSGKRTFCSGRARPYEGINTNKHFNSALYTDALTATRSPVAASGLVVSCLPGAVAVRRIGGAGRVVWLMSFLQLSAQEQLLVNWT